MFGPGVVVLAVDDLSSRVHGSSGQKAIRKFNIVGVRKKKKRAATKKTRGGASEPSPGGQFPRSSLAEVRHRRPFFRQNVVVLLCGWGVAAPRGRRGPSGTRGSQLFGGGVETKIFLTTPKKRHYHDVSVLYNKDER